MTKEELERRVSAIASAMWNAGKAQGEMNHTKEFLFRHLAKIELDNLLKTYHEVNGANRVARAPLGGKNG